MSSATFARRRGQASDVIVSTAINPWRQRAYGAAEFSVSQLTCMSRYFTHRFCTRVCYVRHSSYYILLTIQNMVLAYMHDIMHGINLVTLYSWVCTPPSASCYWCFRQYLSSWREVRSLGLGLVTVLFFFIIGWSKSPVGHMTGSMWSCDRKCMVMWLTVVYSVDWFVF